MLYGMQIKFQSLFALLQVIERIGDVFRIAVPLTLYFALMWSATLVLFWKLGFGYPITITQVGALRDLKVFGFRPPRMTKDL